MARKPQIERAKNNKDKQQTYAKFLGIYKQSVEQGYYGEAELIVYAYMEDRLRALLYYIEAINTRDIIEINEQMQSLIGETRTPNGVVDKIKVIEASMEKCDDAKDQNKYAAFLAEVYKHAFDNTEFEKCLEAIKKWCRYRNEVIHGLFNKNIEDLYKGYRQHVNDGYDLARELDNYVRQLKQV